MYAMTVFELNEKITQIARDRIIFQTRICSPLDPLHSDPSSLRE